MTAPTPRRCAWIDRARGPGLWFVASEPARAQTPVPRVFNGAPAASWIAAPDVPGDAYGVFHFRRTLDLPARPERFTVHVSGDNRYRLFVNGQQVSSGPQRSDIMHWRYETVDLAPQLRAGRNVLAALVWNWGPERPVAQFSHRRPSCCKGTASARRSRTPAASGRCSEPRLRADPGPRPGRRWLLRGASGGVGRRQPLPVGLGAGRIRGRSWPVPAVTEGWGAERTQLRGTAVTGEGGSWQLVPRSIPPMEETVVRFAKVRRAEGIAPGDGVPPGHAATWSCRRARRSAVLLDQSHLTNAYAVLETSGGAGSTIALTYAEALKDAKGEKGNRNEIDGKTVLGLKDVFRPGGGEHRRFQTLWFRCYRYVQMEIETGDEPLRIHDLHGIFTGYPFQEKARFAAAELPWIKDMWEMDWRVARLCAFETYFDTPYYEQLQYIGDTRIQALISLYMTGDDRLVRQAIEHFDASRIPEGITASRYPSALGQYIPTFSLIWVAMVHDYWMHRDDPAFVRGFLPGVRGVLGWYERHVDATGLLGPMRWWGFVDWAKEWPTGIPPACRTATPPWSPCSSPTLFSGEPSWSGRSASPRKRPATSALPRS